MKAAVFGILALLQLWAAPASVQAQFTFTTNADGLTATITGYSGPGSGVTLIIPDTTNGLTVTGIGEHAFIRHLGLTSVTIPETVATIGDNAFASCPSLSNVTILPGDLAVIGNTAFSNCVSLTNFTLPDNLASIGAGAFAGAGLTNVNIPGTITNFGTGAFSDCRSLAQATINYGVTNLADIAFSGCLSLTGVAIPATVTSIGDGTFDSCLRLTNVTIPASVTNIMPTAFWFCSNLFGVYFAGNAPAVAGNVFNHAPRVTIYELTATTGWTAFTTQTGLKPVPWNPVIQTGNQTTGGIFGVQSNRFGFNISGTDHIPIVIEASTNLASPVWTTLQSLTVTNGLVYFSEPLETNTSGRFYRIRSP